MPIKTLQPTFSGGEFAPSLYSRVDLSKYATGLKTARNFFIHPHGGASNRQGTEFIAATKNTAKKSRLIPFEFSTEQAYVLEFGEGYVRYYSEGAPVYVTTGFKEFDPSGSYLPGEYVKISPQAMFWVSPGGGYLAVTPPSSVTAEVNTFIDVSADDNMTVTLTGGGPYIHLANTTPAKNSAALIQAALRAADASLVAWTVTEDADYAASRPTTVSGGSATFKHASFYSLATGYFRCVVAVTGNTDNTSKHPSLPQPVQTWINTSLLETPTPYLEADLPDLKFTQSADVLYLTHPNYAPRMLVRYAVDEWMLENFVFNNGPFMLSNIAEGKTLSVDGTAPNNYSVAHTISRCEYGAYGILLHTSSAHGLTTGDSVKILGLDGALAVGLNNNIYSVEVVDATRFYLYLYQTTTYLDGGYFISYNPTTGTANSLGVATMTANTAIFESGHVGSLWEIRHDIVAQQNTVARSSNGTTTGTGIKCGKTWRITTSGTWTGTVEVQKSEDSGATWTLIRSFSSTSDFNVNTFGEVAKPCLVRAVASFSGGTSVNAVLNTDAYEHIGIVQILTVASSTSATVNIMQTLGDTTATYKWAQGSWSAVMGWPSTVIFYQDRLCFAGTASEPQTIWMSQTGVYDDFGRSSPLLDTDGITVSLPSRKMNGIKNLLSFGDILALTASTEWSIGPGNTGVITPTSVTTKLEGYRGSATVDPIIVGNRALYFQPMGAVLRDMGYSFEANGYNGEDLTIIANHLFDQHSIVEMAYQQEPDSLLWCIREDGKLLSLTYLREQEVFAWTWHETDGLFESVCSIPGDGYNEVWFVVKRTIGGQTARFIERLVPRMASTAPADQIFMDASKTYSGVSATNITGLDHLEGKAVAVLADGNVVTGKTVTSGAITLSTAATKVHVGLPYTCDLETLNVELNLNTGTSQGSLVKISEVTLRFLNSRGGQVGPDSDNSGEHLDTIVTRTSEPLGSPTSLYTGDIKMSIVSGYDVGGRIFFRQANPLPTTILAVIPVIEVGG